MPKTNGHPPGYDFAILFALSAHADRLRLWERQARANGETGRAWQLKAKRRKLMRAIARLERGE